MGVSQWKTLTFLIKDTNSVCDILSLLFVFLDVTIMLDDVTTILIERGEDWEITRDAGLQIYISFLGLHKKLPQTRWLATTEIYSLMILKGMTHMSDERFIGYFSCLFQLVVTPGNLSSSFACRYITPISVSIFTSPLVLDLLAFHCARCCGSVNLYRGAIRSKELKCWAT